MLKTKHTPNGCFYKTLFFKKNNYKALKPAGHYAEPEHFIHRRMGSLIFANHTSCIFRAC